MIMLFRRDDSGAKTARLRAKSRADVDNLVHAACKRLFTPEIHGYDHTCQTAGRERAEGSQYVSGNPLTGLRP